MSKLIIHVGLRKTATTWLQDDFFSKLKNVNYLGKTEEKYSQWLIDWHYLDDYAFSQKKETIRHQLSKLLSKEYVNIISSEAFTNTSVIYSQANRIKEIASDAKIIITLRNPIEIVKSHYKHDLTEGTAFLKIEEYLDWKRTPFYLGKRKRIYLPDFFYDENIDYYQKLFGNENVLVLKFEDMKDNPSSYFSQLSEFMRINIDYTTLNLHTKRNESITQNLSDMKFHNFKNYLKSNMGISFESLHLSKNDFNFTDTIMSKELEEELKSYFKGKCFGYY